MDAPVDDSAEDNAPHEPVMFPPPLPSTPRQAPTPKHRNYVSAHWHGDLSLAVSYWLNFVGLGFVVRLLIKALELVDWIRHPLHWALIAALATMLSCIVIAVWQYVGVWRSAQRSGSGWSVVARIVIVAGCLGSLGLVMRSVRDISDLVRVTIEERAWNDYSVTPSRDGHAIEAKGTMGWGFAGAVENAFDSHPDVHLLRIDSRGGRIADGVMLHDFLAAHPQITVEAEHLCASACTQAFIGGHQRWATPGMLFGFHRGLALLSSQTSEDYLARQQDTFRKQLAALGANEDFIRLAFAKQDNDVYEPGTEELFDSHIIDAIDVDGRLWHADGWRSEQFLYVRRRNPSARALVEAIDRIAIVQPDIHQTWLRDDLAASGSPLKIATTRSENFWRALYAGRMRQIELAPAANVRRYALALQAALSTLPTTNCGRYGDGMRVEFGAQGNAFMAALGPGYLALFSSSEQIQLPAADWDAHRAVAIRQNRKDFTAGESALADDAYWEKRCSWHKAQIDRLLQANDAVGDLDLRAYLRTR